MDITGITVVYNTKDLLDRAYRSVRKFHPDMKIIIVDNSNKHDGCAQYTQLLPLNDCNVVCIYPGRNIGHGDGMHTALLKVKTKYALIFDSDIEIINSPVKAMLEMFEPDTYGVGYIETTGLDGYEYGVHAHHKYEKSMRYLHPYFQLISVEQYFNFYRYVHHGAPCYLAMLDIHKRGLGSKIIKEFPGLGHTAGKGCGWTGDPDLKYVKHDTRGTRSTRLNNGQGEIEPGWVWNKGLV